MLTVLVIILTGCAASKGFDRGALRGSFGQITTDQDIQAVLALKPQLPSPFKVAVYLNSISMNNQRRLWTEADKNALLVYVDQLKNAGIVSEVYLISDDVAQPNNPAIFPHSQNRANSLKELRLAAARYGADAVLTIIDVSSVDRYNNAAAFLYWTIIGAYVAPGTHSDALVMIKSSLWDVRNEYLYATEEAEGIVQRIGPALLLDDMKSINQAKQVAITEFGKKFTERLIRLNAQKQ